MIKICCILSINRGALAAPPATKYGKADMKKSKILIITAAVLALSSAGAYAQQQGSAASAAGSKGDSAAPTTQQASQPARQQPLNKQASVMRPTKKTNWSKIKTLFE